MEIPDIVIVPLVLFPTAIFLSEAPPPSVIVGVTLPMKVQFVHGADPVILLSTVLPLITHLLELLGPPRLISVKKIIQPLNYPY